MLENIRVHGFLLMNTGESPSCKLAHEGRHVSDVEELGHLYQSELFGVDDCECLTARHPSEDIRISFVIKESHQLL